MPQRCVKISRNTYAKFLVVSFPIILKKKKEKNKKENNTTLPFRL